MSLMRRLGDKTERLRTEFVEEIERQEKEINEGDRERILKRKRRMKKESP